MLLNKITILRENTQQPSLLQIRLNIIKHKLIHWVFTRIVLIIFQCEKVKSVLFKAFYHEK